MVSRIYFRGRVFLRYGTLANCWLQEVLYVSGLRENDYALPISYGTRSGLPVIPRVKPPYTHFANASSCDLTADAS